MAKKKVGRPRNAVSSGVKEVRDLLNNNRARILQKAILLATSDPPNISVLLKLLDKILPTLSSLDFEKQLVSEEKEETRTSNKEIEQAIMYYAKYAAEREDSNEE